MNKEIREDYKQLLDLLAEEINVCDIGLINYEAIKNGKRGKIIYHSSNCFLHNKKRTFEVIKNYE